MCPSRCAKVKLPSWRGPNAFLDGILTSNRYMHGFMPSDDDRIYVFGGTDSQGDKCEMIPTEREWASKWAVVVVVLAVVE
jgi:hypothetical protein